MTFAEHRVHPRASLSWPVSLKIERRITEGVTKDISEGGAYVCCATPLGPKAEFCMVINAPDKEINVKAEVVWANTYSLNEEITPTGMGVRFMDITGEDRGIIAKAVAEHLAKNKTTEDLQTSLLDTLEIE
jgi:c-di-GMP-binding flagellar brake protein YcgR